MALALSDLSKTEVKKHVGAIHVDGKLSLLQRKLANVLLWNAYDELLTAEKHRIRISDLAFIVGFDSNDRETLKNAFRELSRVPLEWNLLHENGEKEWGIAPMLAQATLRGAYCSYAYAPDLREKFYNPEFYARINLGIQRNISSGYALTMYENCVRFRRVGSTGWIDLETYRTLLGVGDSKYYRVFKQFNNKILKPAIKAINESSDIYLTVEFEREKRRVTKLRFKVEDNPQMSLFAEAQEAVPALPNAGEDSLKAVRERLLSFGVTQYRADQILKLHPEDYIQQNLDVVERDFQAGKVENLPAYTTAALKNDYRPKKTPFEVEQANTKEQAKNRRQERKNAQERLEGLQSDFQAWRLGASLENLSEDESEALRARFLEESRGQVMFQRWIKKGFDNKVVQSLFRGFAAKELLDEPQTGEFEAFVKQKGEDLTVLRQAAA